MASGYCVGKWGWIDSTPENLVMIIHVGIRSIHLFNCGRSFFKELRQLQRHHYVLSCFTLGSRKNIHPKSWDTNKCLHLPNVFELHLIKVGSNHSWLSWPSISLNKRLLQIPWFDWWLLCHHSNSREWANNKILRSEDDGFKTSLLLDVLMSILISAVHLGCI